LCNALKNTGNSVILKLKNTSVQYYRERKHAEETTRLAYIDLDQIFQTASDGMRIIDILQTRKKAAV